MTNPKFAKRSLIFSAIALVLSAAMLFGATFAWFTDGVTVERNKIVAGNLDVELLHKNSYVGADEVVESDTKLFVNKLGEDILWEPGAAGVETFTIVNKGTVALKYELAITGYDYNDFNGKTLMDALSVITVNNGVSTEPLNKNTFDGVLEAGEKAVISVSVKWVPTTTDNDFNLKDEANLGNGKYATSDGQPLWIDMGVNLVATQADVEFDSNGNDYDADAKFPIIVSTTEELAAALAEDAQDIFVVGAVDMSLARAGQNTDVKGLNITGASADASLTMVGTGGGIANVNLKNITVIDSTFYTSENGENAWEFTYLEFAGTNTFVNVVFEDGIFVGGGKSTFVDCSFSGHNNDSSEYGNTTMYGAWVYSGSASFTNCDFTGTRGLKVADQYSGSDVTDVVVDKCFFGPLSEKPGVAVDNRLGGLNLVIKNSTFAGTQPGDGATNSANGVPYIYENDNRTPDTTTITLENNTVAGYATSSNTLKDEINNAKPGSTIFVGEGNFSLPSMTGKTDVTIIGAADGSTTLSGVNSFGFGTNTTIKNVTISGSNAVRYGYTHGDVVFENVVFDGTGTYGFHVDNANGGTITFNNCTFKGFNALASTGTYYFNECEFLNNGNQGHTNMWGTGYFNDCTFGASTSVGRGGSYPGSGSVIIDGEDIGYQRDFIGSVKDLRNMRSNVDKYGCKKDESYVLVADIDLNGNFWYPIKGTFAGTFDGNGYTISNMDLAHEYVGRTSNVAFFTSLGTTAVIKNVTFDSAKVYGEHYVAVVVGWEGNETTNAVIENVTVQNSTVTCNTDSANDNGDKAGAIAGYAVTLTIKNCTVKDTTITAYRDFGGIIGYANSKVIVSGNTVENVTLVIDNDVNYKNYTTDAEHDANPVVGEAVATAKIENNIVK